MTACKLVYQDPRFYLVSKAAGVSFHQDDDEAGLLPQVRELLNDDAIWPVHRLDKVTSGLLLLARSSEVAAQLGAAFAERRVSKFYLALSAAKPKRKQGLIRGDMLKARGGAWRLSETLANPAITQFFSFSLTPGLRLFVLKPHTGRTHQLRVAMKSLGAPIYGDELYGGAEADRAYLHAWRIRFALDGESFDFCDLPDSGEAWPQELLAATLQQHEAANLPWPRLPGLPDAAGAM